MNLKTTLMSTSIAYIRITFMALRKKNNSLVEFSFCPKTCILYKKYKIYRSNKTRKSVVPV